MGHDGEIDAFPCCARMGDALRDEDEMIIWTAKFREIGLRVPDGGDSVVVIQFCPWCGSRFPETLRNEWFNELERRNIDPCGSGVPPEFLDERWYAGQVESHRLSG